MTRPVPMSIYNLSSELVSHIGSFLLYKERNNCLFASRILNNIHNSMNTHCITIDSKDKLDNIDKIIIHVRNVKSCLKTLSIKFVDLNPDSYKHQCIDNNILPEGISVKLIIINCSSIDNILSLFDKQVISSTDVVFYANMDDEFTVYGKKVLLNLSTVSKMWKLINAHDYNGSIDIVEVMSDSFDLQNVNMNNIKKLSVHVCSDLQSNTGIQQLEKAYEICIVNALNLCKVYEYVKLNVTFLKEARLESVQFIFYDNMYDVDMYLSFVNHCAEQIKTVKILICKSIQLLNFISNLPQHINIQLMCGGNVDGYIVYNIIKRIVKKHKQTYNITIKDSNICTYVVDDINKTQSLNELRLKLSSQSLRDEWYPVRFM